MLHLGALVIVALAAGRAGIAGWASARKLVNTILGLALAAGPAEGLAHIGGAGLTGHQLHALLSGLSAPSQAANGLSLAVATFLTDPLQRARWRCLKHLMSLVTQDVARTRWDGADALPITGVDARDAHEHAAGIARVHADLPDERWRALKRGDAHVVFASAGVMPARVAKVVAVDAAGGTIDVEKSRAARIAGGSASSRRRTAITRTRTAGCSARTGRSANRTISAPRRRARAHRSNQAPRRSVHAATPRGEPLPRRAARRAPRIARAGARDRGRQADARVVRGRRVVGLDRAAWVAPCPPRGGSSCASPTDKGELALEIVVPQRARVGRARGCGARSTSAPSRAISISAEGSGCARCSSGPAVFTVGEGGVPVFTARRRDAPAGGRSRTRSARSASSIDASEPACDRGRRFSRSTARSRPPTRPASPRCSSA